MDILFAIHITNNERRSCGLSFLRRAAFIAILYEKEEIPGYEQDIDVMEPQFLHFTCFVNIFKPLQFSKICGGYFGLLNSRHTRYPDAIALFFEYKG
jgi:hypothetical protein